MCVCKVTNVEFDIVKPEGVEDVYGCRYRTVNFIQ